MGKSKLSLLFIWLFFINKVTTGQEIFRFEHFNTKDGLSQNTVSSLLCDKKGYLWIGTMNGLNRYDGYQFKVYKSNKNNAFLTNYRVTQLWQDSNEFIWLNTYDNYYHYLNPKTERFNTIPKYNDLGKQKTNHATYFHQQDEQHIWIGTSVSGAYLLTYNNDNDSYSERNFIDKGRFSLSNKSVNFIHTSPDSSVWIGTDKGLNLLTSKDIQNGLFHFQHLFINHSLSTVTELKNEIWFGSDKGIIAYNKDSKSFRIINNETVTEFKNNKITSLHRTAQDIVIIAFAKNGAITYNTKTHEWQEIDLHGDKLVDVYTDRFNNAWLTCENLGVTRLNLETLKSEYYELTKKRQKSVTDHERHVFYEDKDNNLWIGLHGGGLLLYKRKLNTFESFINDMNNPNSISSNIIHCIIEDHSDNMWLGTGQFQGGMEKIVKRNPGFSHLMPHNELDFINENVIRSIKQDPNNCIWIGTKSGELIVYSPDLKKLHSFSSFKTQQKTAEQVNIYSIFIDKNKHIWLGSKGEGLFISNTPIPDTPAMYDKLTFKQYIPITNDSTSLPGLNVYSINEDAFNNIWIGTFGDGLCFTRNNDSKNLTFKRYNTNNSALSNDLVRYVKADSDSNLWVATSFGLNLVRSRQLEKDSIAFETFFHNSKINESLSYNDIIIIKEDSNKKLWFGTFGGGVNQLCLPVTDSLRFKVFNTDKGLSNDVVYAIEEEDDGHVWFSSENGLSRYNPEHNSIEVYNEYNGLSFNNFSEGTSTSLRDGRIVFGGFKGIEIIEPRNVRRFSSTEQLELTNFQLFNKNVIPGIDKSPLKRNISYTKHITLNHSQSSFSFEYSALDLIDPKKIQYAYMLENFDNEWNYVNNQTKATYTNLPPGKYVFKVKCTNQMGQWQNTTRNLEISIQPPWWMTKWAYALYIVILSIILWLVRVIIQHINSYRTELSVEKKVNSLKLKFFTNISHEIRTPLTLILGPINDLLNDNELDESISKQIKTIRKNANRMLQLVNQLLDFRKVQNNKMNLYVQPIELNAFTQAIYENFIPLANHKNIFYSFKQHDVPVEIWGDRIKIDSIIYNLISNAIKFTPEGKKVTISVDITQPDNLACIRVIDQGPGISEKNMADIFSRYTILSDHDFAGTGIGLSLAYELAVLHKGKITLTSEVNQGSSFCFMMPSDSTVLLKERYVKVKGREQATPVEHTAEIPLDNTSENQQTQDSKSTILLVEDNPEISAYVKDKLSELYNCATASNGKEGLNIAKKINPDVIVTDIMMPEMDGKEMTRLLKEDFTTCHIPVIMMTAKTEMEDQIEGIETGAEAYVTKPINMQYFKAVIKTLNQQRQLVISKFRDNKTIDPKTLKVNSKDETFLKNLIHYIEANYSGEISVESLASHCCVSRTVLYNKTKGLTGLSPLELIRDIKLKIANQLLKKGYSVSEVAYEVGYNDIKYFSRLFKQQYGYPPSKIPKSN